MALIEVRHTEESVYMKSFEYAGWSNEGDAALLRAAAEWIEITAGPALAISHDLTFSRIGTADEPASMRTQLTIYALST